MALSHTGSLADSPRQPKYAKTSARLRRIRGADGADPVSKSSQVTAAIAKNQMSGEKSECVDAVQSEAGPIECGVTKRSSRPEQSCSFDQSSKAKSITTRPEVGSFSLRLS